jgi:ubiquinone/menaquinone biosynthesis C-methylase UbiE
MAVTQAIGFNRFKTFIGFSAVVAISALVVALSAQQPWNRDFGEDMTRLVPVLDLRAGQSVADIGAGGGELTVRLARQVGPEGRVYATEMSSDRMTRIRRRAEDDGLKNVTVLEGHATRTNLPEACCDAIVIRNVYHHFDDPGAMNQSLFASLKAGGRLAIIDFSPNRGRPTASDASDRDQDNSHGVDVDAVVKEVTAAGFERQAVEKSDDRSFMAVFRKGTTRSEPRPAPYELRPTS